MFQLFFSARRVEKYELHSVQPTGKDISMCTVRYGSYVSLFSVHITDKQIKNNFEFNVRSLHSFQLCTCNTFHYKQLPSAMWVLRFQIPKRTLCTDFYESLCTGPSGSYVSLFSLHITHKLFINHFLVPCEDVMYCFQVCTLHTRYSSIIF